MPNTYVALRTETVAVATSTITFNLSGISGYTDLVFVATPLCSTASNLSFQFNGDTASNYSATGVAGSGSAPFSWRQTSSTVPYLGFYSYTDTNSSSNIISVMNYSNSTTFKTFLCRASNATAGVEGIVGTWRNTAAITSVVFRFTGGANFNVGSTISLYGIANADQGSAKATGGIITEDSQYWYHTFGASGAFIPKQSLTCDVLVVAGGGGGGYGGGGAGGFRTSTGLSVTATTYNVTVGGGGPGRASGGVLQGSNGSDSIFSTITSTGGGGGGGANSAGNRVGANGGSGGGGGYDLAVGTINGGTGNTPSTSPSQGNNGGTSTGTSEIMGGGGGAGAVGGNGSGTASGAGGAGTASSISGFSVTYAGGGGGAGAVSPSRSAGVGGTGGGGAGSTAGNGTAGTVNTGGGGGGGNFQGTPNTGGTGGSGVVIIRYSK